uniref:Uncharacterized protein n=1 Tax=Panagrolaimus sp. JU765 TaxID=591449 RepID=A0AC34QBQ5_9BILA
MYSPTTNLDDSTNYDDFSTIVTTQSETIPLSTVLALDNSQITVDDSPRIPQLAPPLIISAPTTLDPSDKL